MHSFGLSDHKLLHVESFGREVDRRCLPLSDEMAFEPLQGDHEDFGSLEHLNLLDSLFVRLALVTVPLILTAELLRTIEQPEAVGYCHLVRKVLLSLLGLLHLLYVKLLRVESPVKHLEESPATLLVELNHNLEVSLLAAHKGHILFRSGFLLSGSVERKRVTLVAKAVDF